MLLWSFFSLALNIYVCTVAMCTDGFLCFLCPRTAGPRPWHAMAPRPPLVPPFSSVYDVRPLLAFPCISVRRWLPPCGIQPHVGRPVGRPGIPSTSFARPCDSRDWPVTGPEAARGFPFAAGQRLSNGHHRALFDRACQMDPVLPFDRTCQITPAGSRLTVPVKWTHCPGPI